jgi:hypothetical protein
LKRNKCADFILRRVFELKFEGKNSWDDLEEVGSADYQDTKRGRSWKEVVWWRLNTFPP